MTVVQKEHLTSLKQKNIDAKLEEYVTMSFNVII